MKKGIEVPITFWMAIFFLIVMLAFVLGFLYPTVYKGAVGYIGKTLYYIVNLPALILGK